MKFHPYTRHEIHGVRSTLKKSDVSTASQKASNNGNESMEWKVTPIENTNPIPEERKESECEEMRTENKLRQRGWIWCP